MSALRAIVVSQSGLYQDGLIHLLKEQGITTVGCAGTQRGAQAMAQIRKAHLLAVQPSEPRLNAAELMRLTPRELEVLALVAQGLSDAEIASALTISYHTVKNHVGNLLETLNIHGQHSRLRAAVFAAQHGLLDQDDEDH